MQKTIENNPYSKPIEIFTSMDLELNQPSRKIISIGFTIGNITTGTVLEKINLIVNPYEKIHPEIVDLTKITDKIVSNGLSLEQAYHKMKSVHDRYSSFINCLTWGGDDTRELHDQLMKENPQFDKLDDWCFGRRCIDVKTLFVSWRIANGKQIQGGLARSMTKVGLKFNGQKHNSADDAENTFQMYRAMLRLLKEPIKIDQEQKAEFGQ